MNKPFLFAFADEASPQLDGQIRAMVRNRLNGLEIRGVNGKNVTQLTLQEAAEVKCQLADQGLRVWSVGSPIGKIAIHDDFAAHKELLRHTLDLANTLGAANLRMFSFYMPKGEDPAQYRNQVLDQVGQMLEVAKGSGVALCHENEKGIFGDIADRCRDLHEAFPTLKAVFDPANFVQCKEDTLRAWTLLKPFVHYLHIKDALADGYVVPAGSGIGNVAAIVTDYLASGGTTMTLEPHLTIFDGLHTLEQADTKSIVGIRETYPDADTAFDAACAALQHILEEVQL